MVKEGRNRGGRGPKPYAFGRQATASLGESKG
jgi:hypothetical protein